MKKSLVLAAAISSSLLAGMATADDLTWTLKKDSVLDGTLTSETTTEVEGRVFNKQFYFEDKVSSEKGKWFVTGDIEADASEIGSGSASRINFSSVDGTTAVEYKGYSTGSNQYKGTWYGPNGTSGDFTLDASVTNPTPVEPDPQPPLDPATFIVTPSTQYGQHPATALFDGLLGNNNANVWIGVPTDPGASLHIELPSARQYTKYKMSRGYCAAYAYVAGTWQVFGSNDDSNWTQIDNETTDQGALMSCDSLNEYSVDAPGSYKYYRIDFQMSSVNTYTHTGVALGELELIQ